MKQSLWNLWDKKDEISYGHSTDMDFSFNALLSAQPGATKIIYEFFFFFLMMAFLDKHASTTDSLDMCHSESGLGRRLLREEDYSLGVCNAAWIK